MDRKDIDKREPVLLIYTHKLYTHKPYVNRLSYVKTNVFIGRYIKIYYIKIFT